MASSARGELNARQRKHVYMHSTIFDAEGPTNKSVYAPSRQQELFDGLNHKIRRNNQQPPDMLLPTPADIQCTQNAGHGVVMPSNHAHHQPLAGPSPRTSNAEALVGDGSTLKVTRATPHKGANGHIPKEFWATSVNLQWHDPRNEISRNKAVGRDGAAPTAQDLKLQEMSSEVFGKARLTEASTKNPRQELLAETAHIMSKDSSLDYSHQPGRQPQSRVSSAGYSDTSAPAAHPAVARSKLHQNLMHSEHNTMTSARGVETDRSLPAAPEDEDPAFGARRRQEKNFSDLFGAQMGERKDVRGREEVTASRTCSFLDTRSEIATRNKNNWRHDDDAKPANRKEAERDSRLFDYNCPGRPEHDASQHAVHHQERSCWDTKDIMDAGSEIARRRRMKDHHPMDGVCVDGTNGAQVTAYDRKQEDLGSRQIRIGIGTVPPPPVSPRSPISAGFKGGYVAQDRRPVTAKDTKIASLQSSIFS